MFSPLVGYYKMESQELQEKVNTLTLDQSSASSPTVPLLQVQVKVQVQHLVRADTSLTASNIRAFSGTSPKPGELWKQAESMRQDDHISEVIKKQKLMGSLRSPALDLVKGMGEISSTEICRQLEVMYGCSSSGAKVFFFLNETHRIGISTGLPAKIINAYEQSVDERRLNR